MADAIRIDVREIQQAARALRALSAGKLLEAAKPTAFRLLIEAQNAMKALVSGPVLQVRTGALRGSIQVEPPTVQGASLTGRVGLLKEGPAQRYGHFLIRGGTITAKKKFLAIPIGPALTGAGVPRFKSPRDLSDLFFVPGRQAGTGVLVRVTGKGRNRRLQPYFALRHSVTIRAHDYVTGPQQELERKAVTTLPRIIAGMITIKE